MHTERYEPPRLLATYSIAELRLDAATAGAVYISDERLKTAVTRVERPVERLRRIARG